MKRMKVVVVAAVLTLLGSAILAAEPETSSGDQMMPMMHKHMQTMQEQMSRIKTTKDPAERKQLMQAHMQSMRKGMMMMGKMEKSETPKMKGDAMEQHRHDSSCKQDDAQCQQMQAMENSQHDTQQRMQMMRMMMEQMMDHQMEKEESGQ